MSSWNQILNLKHKQSLSSLNDYYTNYCLIACRCNLDIKINNQNDKILPQRADFVLGASSFQSSPAENGLFRLPLFCVLPLGWSSQPSSLLVLPPDQPIQIK